MSKVKKCSVETSTNKYLHCPKHDVTLQNPTLESEKEFYAEHNGAIEQITNEVQILELLDRNDAQAIHIKRLDKLITLCIRIAVMANDEVGLFSPKIRDLINQFNKEQMDTVESLREALKL